MIFELKNVSFSYGKEPVLGPIDLKIPSGKVVGVLGPNGSGKSTLLKLLSRLLEPQQGEIFLEGKDLRAIPLKELAKKVAVVEQDPWIEHPFRVEEVVGMGRYPHLDGMRLERLEDREKVTEILKNLKLTPFRERRLTEMSAGERQRVFLAKALVQETPILLLDEPVAHLDLHYQIEALQALQKRCQDQGITIILVLHDLLLASLFCDQLVLIKNGVLKASGVPTEILTPLHIQEVFGVKAALEIDLPHRRLSLTF